MKSQGKKFVTFTTLAALVALSSVFVTGCGGKKSAEEESVTPTAPAADDTALGDSDSGRALGMQTVNFPYDSFVLEAEGKRVLDGNVAILKDKPSVKVQVEGHCDQRGGIQYNIALGEKRANAVKKYLEGKGIAGDRVTTISYGKERPLDPGTTEDAHGKNRRGNFVITSR